MAPKRHAQVLKKIEETDAFSMNLNEAKVFFGLDTLDHVLEELHKIGKPCFFRAGEKGAYMLQDGQTVFSAGCWHSRKRRPHGLWKLLDSGLISGLCRRVWPLADRCYGKCGGGFQRTAVWPWPLVMPQARSEARRQKRCFCSTPQRHRLRNTDGTAAPDGLCASEKEETAVNAV